MFDPAICRRMHLAVVPTVSCEALLDLKSLLRCAPLPATDVVLQAQHRSLLSPGGADAKVTEPQGCSTLAGDTRIVRTKLQDEILKLKQEQGKNILIGGVTIPSQLIELGLVDEYHFVVQPIVVGEGSRLLEGISLQERLQFFDSTSFRFFNQDVLRFAT